MSGYFEGGSDFSVKFCLKLGINTVTLKVHVESKHEELRYPCSQCEYIATQASALKVHVENKHKGVRYPCSQCEYIAIDTSNLKKNMLNVNIELSE